MGKRQKLISYRRVSTPQINQDHRMRRVEQASNLLNRFSVHSPPRLAFQNENDFIVYTCMD